MDLGQYRQTESERRRTQDLFRIISNLANANHSALDIGARDGYFSKLLADQFKRVTALDLVRPDIAHDKVDCVAGDVTALEYQNGQFQFVFCCEVLEHISPNLLKDACSELSRVCSDYLLIGVPYKQDTRSGRTTCRSCGQKNPPWGHVNSFDEKRLIGLFPSLAVSEVSFVGSGDGSTNFVSAYLLDLAGNPYGTYEQDEVCINCGNRLGEPKARNLAQKLFTKAANVFQMAQDSFSKKHPNWVHILFRKV